MKNYISVKQVKAEPMSLGQYYKYKGYTIPDADNISANGYKVCYPDGYVSWCPKEIFEKQYLEIEKENTISQSDVNNFISEIETIQMGNKTTVVQATLKNGFNITESSACVDPQVFDMEVGKQCCMEQIEYHVWGLLGFLLCSAKNGFKRDK